MDLGKAVLQYSKVRQILRCLSFKIQVFDVQAALGPTVCAPLHISHQQVTRERIRQPPLSSFL